MSDGFSVLFSLICIDFEKHFKSGGVICAFIMPGLQDMVGIGASYSPYLPEKHPEEFLPLVYHWKATALPLMIVNLTEYFIEEELAAL